MDWAGDPGLNTIHFRPRSNLNVLRTVYKRYNKARCSVAKVLVSGLPRLESFRVPVLLAPTDPTLRPHFIVRTNEYISRPRK